MTVDVHVSSGTAFTIQRWATRQGGFWDAQRWLVGDFTGDGRQDLLKLWNDGGAMTVDVHVSTGTAFAIQRWATRQGGFWNSQNWIVGDFNGDRRSDLAKYWNDAGAMTIDVHPSSGTSFGMQRWATRQGGIWAGQTWMLGDFNGDRRTDLTKIWRDSVARTALVADQGGILASSEVHLHVLPETFTTPTTVTVTLMYEEVPNMPDGLIGLNTRYELVATEQASGTPAVPTQPMTLTVAYDADDVMLLNEESLALYRWNGVEWLLEPSSSVDSEANTITITTHQQGPWAVFSAQTYKHYLPLIVR
ncbi:MAG: hypothetical protein EOM24_30640 [Chloroflexia bacterium]|nr:hypothetical protein [Chloroflexia bacterium]